jgi:alpha/beta superfamily hydrolase
LQVLPGSDHFFFGREGRIADAVAAHLAAVPGL